MSMKNVITLLVLCLFLGSCKHDEEKKVVTPCGVRDASYRGDIKPIISKNCASCHHEFLIYDSLNAVCIEGGFSKRVFVVKDMPPTGIDTCDLITLKRWYYNGHTPY
jgi:hypothetical protein